MLVLGIYGAVTSGQHDPCAALVEDGAILAVCEEERYLRVKGAWGRLPLRSIEQCLELANRRMEDVDLVVVPGEILQELPERTSTYLRHHFGFAPPVEVVHHHVAHLASAFYCSGFEEAMCLSYDGYGDGVSIGLARATRRDGIEVLELGAREQSLGVFYSTITCYLGFKIAEDEFKVMGLAPYGHPEAVDLSPFVSVDAEDFRIDPQLFRPGHQALSNDEPIFGRAVEEAFGAARSPSAPLLQRHMDVAHAAQAMLERCARTLVARLHRLTGLGDLCIAGGVGLNCSVNRRVAELPDVDRLFVQPAASDRGLALGAALQGAALHGDVPDRPLEHVFYGSGYDDDAIVAALDASGFSHRRLDDVVPKTVELLASGSIVGWYHGRSEFGPRALGHRSILADPRSAATKDLVNRAVKFRESFRPFAPSVVEGRATEFFDIDAPSRFMTRNAVVREGKVAQLGAVTHVDGTSRVHTVEPSVDPLFHRLLEHFGDVSGVPALLNTSFNVRGQPIVESPRDAVAAFAGSGLDALVIGDHLVVRSGAPR